MEFFPSRAVALQILGLEIHWYGVMYFLAFVTAYRILPRLQAYRGLNLTRDQWSVILTYVIAGVIIGGRLGFVVFYRPYYFIENPAEIIAVWNGGMSSHGGFLGVIAALYLSQKKLKFELLRLLDIAVIPAAIGLAFGRFGNFVNGELYGIETTVPWAMQFNYIDGLRHPVQLYSVAKDLFIAGVCYLHLVNVRPVRPGQTAGLFLILYGLLRFAMEYVREQTAEGFDLGWIYLTRGQGLTLPFLILGMIVVIMTKRSPVNRG